jgi:GH15 family glucan-1,4-alpha-glucosidase
MAKHRQAPVSGSLPNPVPGRSIEEHGIVGNLETAALVALDGTIDFMCWPAFDGPSVFAALLDPDRGGCFELAPVLEEARAAQLYLPDTNVLMTRWLSENGSAELVDLMPFPTKHGTRRMLVRRMRATRGRVPIRLCCHPRFDYARAETTVRRREDGIHFTAKGAVTPARDLRPPWWLGSQEDEENRLRRLSLPACDHSAGDLAVFSIHFELPRR